MRTRMPSKVCVRQVARPLSPGCTVGSMADQSVVPNGMLDISMSGIVRRRANTEGKRGTLQGCPYPGDQHGRLRSKGPEGVLAGPPRLQVPGRDAVLLDQRRGLGVGPDLAGALAPDGRRDLSRAGGRR